MTDDTHIFDGGIFACPNDPKSEENCYIDWGAEKGIIGKTDASIVETDGDNWVVIYACS